MVYDRLFQSVIKNKTILSIISNSDMEDWYSSNLCQAIFYNFFLKKIVKINDLTPFVKPILKIILA